MCISDRPKLAFLMDKHDTVGIDCVAMLSLIHLCERQMENYRHLLARFHRPKNERESIVICGADGRGNAGDDAILEAIVQEMRQLDPERTICVMSRRPKETRLIYRTNAIYTFNVFSVLRKFRHAALYINGGGSLMQDVTSTRSIWYYCYTLYAAKMWIRDRVRTSCSTPARWHTLPA